MSGQKDIGKNTIIVCITYWPESVKDLISQQKSLLMTAGKLKDSDKPPPEWFSGADFVAIHNDLRANAMSDADSYLSVKQEGYCLTYFPTDKSEIQPVVEVSVKFQSGNEDTNGQVENLIIDRIGDHWLNKCYIRNTSKTKSSN
ncbi:PREDICTED: uncharacterized protein LOC109581340 isoform X2 [Amphimedon queenslandica]|uniref:Uncharacterized protein n=1 Tax=Amphimedon queenslandica TaxID=400682 RepID=A0A1X7V3E2_AMPQE|nr:PREDICTED: uncharacterized protein LOC109581340 isoform X2 [Amphimedon queenslandica]|eukprot:XP_019850952.1 PREDICTED: uncharacterized protein LOC109581340 isoform X2 [Amphimedon queenslandica]